MINSQVVSVVDEMLQEVILVQCPHCGETVPLAGFCERCKRILPPAERSYWEVLGYDREIMNLDPADLEKRFFELSRKFHPDRFASKSALEVQVSHDHSSAVNNAYRTLKDPVARAGCLVERKLGAVSEKSAKVPPEMAEFFFEVQEYLEEIRHSGGNPPENAVREVRKAEETLGEKVKDLDARLQASFLEYDASPDIRIVEEMKEILAERSYIKSFQREMGR
ncbi:MAG TPA: Fe-S protein assembly co-chaperone HscB [Acidobacteriota bacterium]|nr:Fe-S protein assembly co-chaperone HscB [Acidobacteriota bacterium]